MIFTKNYRKRLILLILLVTVATFTISPTFATTKTVHLNKMTYYSYKDGTAWIGYSKKITIESRKFTIGSGTEVDLRKGNKIYTYSNMGVGSNKKFESVTLYKFNVKTLKFVKKTVKAYRLPKEWRSKESQYSAEYSTSKSSNWIPHKIVINY